MSGEVLFQTFDAARYREIAPCLDELRMAQTLSGSALALFESLLDPPPER
jgi:hypothetical protein